MAKRTVFRTLIEARTSCMHKYKRDLSVSTVRALIISHLILHNWLLFVSLAQNTRFIERHSSAAGTIVRQRTAEGVFLYLKRVYMDFVNGVLSLISFDVNMS